MKKFYNESDLVFAEKPKDIRFQDLGGQKFNRLTILGFAKSGHWFCRCDCGNITMVFAGDIKSGHTASCGCLQAERAKKAKTIHGHTKGYVRTPTHKTWTGMISRCQNPDNINFLNYGGRGIRVCERWQKFENFLEDMGERPEVMSIDRIDNNGNYEPGNCRWATNKEQGNNTRSNIFLTFNGRTQTMTQWSDEIGVSKYVIWTRINKLGWSTDKTLSTPVGNKQCLIAGN